MNVWGLNKAFVSSKNHIHRSVIMLSHFSQKILFLLRGPNWSRCIHFIIISKLLFRMGRRLTQPLKRILHNILGQAPFRRLLLCLPQYVKQHVETHLLDLSLHLDVVDRQPLWRQHNWELGQQSLLICLVMFGFNPVESLKSSFWSLNFQFSVVD